MFNVHDTLTAPEEEERRKYLGKFMDINSIDLTRVDCRSKSVTFCEIKRQGNIQSRYLILVQLL